jgi:hypothetical protein
LGNAWRRWKYGVVDNKCWEMRESLEKGWNGKEEEIGNMDGRIFIQFRNFSVFTDKNGPSTINTITYFK